MPAYAHLCLALLVPSLLFLCWGLVLIHIRRGHAAFVALAGIRESQKSEGGYYRGNLR
jgi:hypothetical protein